MSLKEKPFKCGNNTSKSFQKVGVPHMVWPTVSFDLKPIEIIWDQLKRRTDDRTPPARDQAELYVEEWNVLSQNNIMRSVRSKRRR
uniref:Tc1-like transposase DDE domain-containing protein n=1 Tax=Oryzias melastigma TaxID=30732 RepID=A0A3B3B6T8_ORYME